MPESGAFKPLEVQTKGDPWSLLLADVLSIQPSTYNKDTFDNTQSPDVWLLYMGADVTATINENWCVTACASSAMCGCMLCYVWLLSNV